MVLAEASWSEIDQIKCSDYSERFGNDFSSVFRSSDLLLPNQHFCFDCSQTVDVYVGHAMALKARNMSSADRFPECCCLIRYIITFSIERMCANCLQHCEIE